MNSQPPLYLNVYVCISSDIDLFFIIITLSEKFRGGVGRWDVIREIFNILFASGDRLFFLSVQLFSLVQLCYLLRFIVLVIPHTVYSMETLLQTTNCLQWMMSR